MMLELPMLPPRPHQILPCPDVAHLRVVGTCNLLVFAWAALPALGRGAPAAGAIPPWAGSPHTHQADQEAGVEDGCHGEKGTSPGAGKALGPGGCLASCFPLLHGDAEPSAGGGNAIKRLRGSGGAIQAGSSLSGHRRSSTGSSCLTANLPAALPAAPGPVPAQNKPQGKQVRGQERQQVRPAHSPALPHAPIPRVSAASASAPLAPRAPRARRHQGSCTMQSLVPGFADLVGEAGPPFRGGCAPPVLAAQRYPAPS